LVAGARAEHGGAHKGEGEGEGDEESERAAGGGEARRAATGEAGGRQRPGLETPAPAGRAGPGEPRLVCEASHTPVVSGSRLGAPVREGGREGGGESREVREGGTPVSRGLDVTYVTAPNDTSTTLNDTALSGDPTPCMAVRARAREAAGEQVLSEDTPSSAKALGEASRLLASSTDLLSSCSVVTRPLLGPFALESCSLTLDPFCWPFPCFPLALRAAAAAPRHH